MFEIFLLGNLCACGGDPSLIFSHCLFFICVDSFLSLLLALFLVHETASLAQEVKNSLSEAVFAVSDHLNHLIYKGERVFSMVCMCFSPRCARGIV